MDEAVISTGYVYEDGEVMSLADYLFVNKMRPEYCGLTKVPFFQNCYNLYYDFSSRNGFPSKGFNGICLDLDGSIKTSHVPKGLVALSIVTFKS